MKEQNKEPLYNYLDPLSNDKLSDLKGLDLLELITLMNDFYLDLREELNIDKKATFGLELEFEDAPVEFVSSIISKEDDLKKWIVKHELSIYNGAEINSPIMTDTKENWKDLDKVCELISPHATAGMNTGGHIHVGSHIIGESTSGWLNFLKIWATYENILFRFLDGEHLTARPGIEEYARPVAKEFIETYLKNVDDYKDVLSVLRALRGTRYQAVNFGKTELRDPGTFRFNNTVEFRSPNGTLNPVIWQNNVNTLVKLMEYSRSMSYDDDKVEKRLKSIKKDFENLYLYDEIYIDQALELSDMLFNNNLDKIYFLKQYFKSFEINDQKEEYPKAKVLTKKMSK